MPFVQASSFCENADELTTFSAQALFNKAPNYQHAIRAGKDARHLWFALREWRGDDPEGYFGDLGA